MITGYPVSKFGVGRLCPPYLYDSTGLSFIGNVRAKGGDAQPTIPVLEYYPARPLFASLPSGRPPPSRYVHLCLFHPHPHLFPHSQLQGNRLVMGLDGIFLSSELFGEK